MTSTHGEEVADTENLRELHGALLSTQSVEQFLHEMAVMAARLAGGLSCGMTMQPSGRPVTVACSDQVAARVDEVQYELDDGPCLHAMRDGSVVRIEDTTAVVSSMRTTLPSRMACRHGPSSSSYCTSSTRAATWSLHATVTGLPLGCIVIPHDRPPARRAAITAISCRNCSTLWVLSSAPCNSLRFSVSATSSPCVLVMASHSSRFRPPTPS